MRTNWKLFALLFGGIFIVPLFLSFIGFSRVSTDKSIYSTGENIIVSFYDFRLYRCTNGPLLIFSRQTPDGWETIRTDTNMGLSVGESVCIDDKEVIGGVGEITGATRQKEVIVPDIQAACSFFSRPYISGSYNWNPVIYEAREKGVCGDLKEPVISYQSIPVPPGKYKVNFGFAEKIFEIQGN